MCGFIRAFGSDKEVLSGKAQRRTLERKCRRSQDDYDTWQVGGRVLGLSQSSA